MKKILIWDVPTRVFHWGFALTLSASSLLALVADEHGPLFRWHMLLGLMAVGFLYLRILHGFVGTRFARFGSLPLNPAEILRYAKGVVAGGAPRYLGHNPGSALAAVVMAILVMALVVTGAGFGGGEGEEAHGAIAYTLMAVVGLHLAGIALHNWRHRENVGLSMVTGRKLGPAEAGMTSNQAVWGLAFLLAGLAWAGGVVRGYDEREGTTRLPLAGMVIRLGETESGHASELGRSRRHHDDD